MLLPEQARDMVDLYVALRKEAYEKAAPPVGDYFARCRAKVASAETPTTGLPYAVAVHLRTP